MRRFALCLAVVACLFGGVSGLAQTAQAQTQEGLILDCDNVVLNPTDGTVDKSKTTRCGVNDFVAQFVRLAQWGLTIVVFLGALMMVYAGFEFITAGGRAAKISSGQNIITGTVIGLAISMTAYVIINFSIGAITGTKTSTNPFTAIATVFDNPKNEDGAALIKPFSGVDDQKATPSCRTTWNTLCSNEVYCADEEQLDLNGQVATYQSTLKTLGCGCAIDGCFGPNTAQCVRRFQVANDIVPSGVITSATQTALQQANPQRCDGQVVKAKINAVLNQLPATALPSVNLSLDTGCCVVQKNIAGTATPLYCMNDLSERSCAALGSGYVFARGEGCASSNTTRTLCGLCRSADNYCFEETGKYWCEQIAKDVGTGQSFSFENGVCRGGGICSGGCDEALKTQR